MPKHSPHKKLNKTDLKKNHERHSKQQKYHEQQEQDGLKDLVHSIEMLSLTPYAPKKFSWVTLLLLNYYIFSQLRPIRAQSSNMPSIKPESDSVILNQYNSTATASVPSSSTPLLNDFRYLGSNGVISSSYSAFYTDSTGEKYLVKTCQDKLPTNCIREVIGSRLLSEIAGPEASVDPVFPIYDEDSTRIMLASRWDPRFHSKKSLGEKFEYKNGTITYNGSRIDSNLWLIPVISIFMQDSDINTGNFGIIAGSSAHLARIDLGAAFDPEIILKQRMNTLFSGISLPCDEQTDIPHPSPKCLDGLTKSHHRRMYKPRETLPTDRVDYIAALDQILKIPQVQQAIIINEELDKFEKFLGPIKAQLEATLSKRGYLFQSSALILEEDLTKTGDEILSMNKHNYEAFEEIRQDLISRQAPL